MKKLNAKGAAHYAVLAFVIVGIAAVGTYQLVAGHAATCKDYTWKQGQSGTCVKYIQQIVNDAIPKQVSLTTDGSFGPLTTTGVKTFQTDTGLMADGVVGPATWSKLCSSYAVILTTPDPKKAAGC